ncbi:MAG: alpha/beta fold hydrolase [Candidatus Lokiarchaeota archaeon]|nr:alpha/beta fold hydrolase [Candidatus Lokiarchaeota archaeon]
MSVFDKEDRKFFKRIIILVVLLVISLSYLVYDRSISYSRYERVEFRSAGATLFANLYYPSKSLAFQDQRPLVIYCHGIGSQRDFDLRIPVELTKRGFYVAALDYQGHGESGGNIINIDPVTKLPALAQDCSRLLDKLETLPFFSDVNKSQIGLIGHSLGGFVSLMNQALDPRFNVTVAWAPLVKYDPDVIKIFPHEFDDYMPARLLNSTNSKNLLIIMHVEDEVLSYKDNALVAQNLTGCALINITRPLIGGGHQLFANEVIIESIKWFETHFFNSETRNGPINITFLVNYGIIFITLILLVLIVLLLTIYTSKFFPYKPVREELQIQKHNEQKLLMKIKVRVNKVRKILQIVLYTTLFLLNWQIFERALGLGGIFFASLNITAIYFIGKFILYYRKLKKQEIKFNLKQVILLIKSEFQFKYLFYAILCNAYFIGIYLIFSFFYPFAFMWPSNFLNTWLAAVVVFPVYFSLELLFRKVIYPLLNFIKNERKKSLVIILIATFIQLNLMALTWSWAFFPSVIFMYLILLYAIVQNTLIYEKTQRFSTVILSSFDIIQLFFAAVISNAIGIGSALHLFVSF